METDASSSVVKPSGLAVLLFLPLNSTNVACFAAICCCLVSFFVDVCVDEVS